ncbi:MAG: hypothetical protein K1W17_05520 [Oscillospiraceae bacterium]
MNMKKTIAAIAAGAVAVSAMATTVSALESGSLTYNLVNTLEDQSNGKLTIKATFQNVKLVSGQEVVINPKGMGWTDKVVVSGQYIDTNKAIAPMTFTRDIWSEGYSSQTEDMIKWDGIHIPVKAVNDGSPALMGGVATDATPDTPAVDPVPAESEVTDKSVNITAAVADIKVQTAAFAGMAGGTYTIKYDTDKWVILDAEGFSTGKEILVNGATGEADGETLTVKYTAPVEGKPAVPGAPATDGAQMANITVTVTMKAIDEKDWETINKALKHPEHADGIGISLNGVWGDATGSGFTAPTKRRAPLMTYYTDNLNVIEYLEKAHVNGDDKGYANVGAVINDAIENYETVTFTFNTASANVAWGVASIGTDGAKKFNPTFVWTTNDGKQKSRTDVAAEFGQLINKTDKWGESYQDWKYDRDDYIIMGYYPDNDWEGVDTYKAFGDHTYDWFYSPEGTGMVGMDWAGQDLFAGALIVNEKQTMSLGNTEYFDWNKTSISFDWDAIMDGAATTNNYATYVHSLKLATSQYWFWDSMNLVLTAGESDDVSADAGVEADDETLDDEDDEIIDGDDDDEPVADDDEDEEPAPVVDEPAPAPVVTNPPTGNASVALAVIPVALAAAAIVAKKRG